MVDTSLVGGSTNSVGRGLLETGFNVASSLTGGLSNLITDKLQNQYAYNRELEMWNRSNEYNKPIHQMERLREAGLNPNLVYGNSSVTGNTVQSSTPSYQPAHGQFDFGKINAIATMNQFKTTELQQELLEKQSQQIDANIMNTNARTKNILDLLPAILGEKSASAKAKSARAELDSWQYGFNQNVEGYLQEAARLKNIETNKRIAKLGVDISRQKGEISLIPWRRFSLKSGAIDKSWDAYWNRQGIKNPTGLGSSTILQVWKALQGGIDKAFGSPPPDNVESNW